MKKCPFCKKTLSFFDNKKYCQCENCDSEYVEFTNSTNNTNFIQYKTEDYFIYSADKEKFFKTKIYNLESNSLIVSIDSAIPILEKSLNQVNEKIKKLLVYK